MLTSNLVVNLVDPAILMGGRVSMSWRPGLLDIRLDQTVIEPVAGPAIAEMARDGLAQLATMERHPAPVVRYYVERDIPGGKLVSAEVSPWQIDVYVLKGLMPYDVSQEIAGHATHILRRHL